MIGIVGNLTDDTEVIDEAVKAGKKVELFFSEYNDVENTIPSELQRVQEFKEKMKSQSCCLDYNGTTDFETKLKDRFISKLVCY